jgi:hypothetical protein
VDTFGIDRDMNRTVCLLVEIGAFRLVIVVGLVRVGQMQIPGSQHFEPVVEVCPGSEHLGSEAGAGVIDFE